MSLELNYSFLPNPFAFITQYTANLTTQEVLLQTPLNNQESTNKYPNNLREEEVKACWVKDIQKNIY